MTSMPKLRCLKISEKEYYRGLSASIGFFRVLSMFAIFLLPRQFHTIVENNKENTFKQLFGYSRCICYYSIFSCILSLGGNILFEGQA
jgi:hypothetical protein